MDPETPDNPEGADIPDFIPEKFRGDTLEASAEALARSYTEAERRLTELSSQNRAMEENYQMLSQQLSEIQQAQQQPQIDPADANAQLYAMYENDPVGTMALLAQQAAQTTVQQTMAQQQPVTAQQAEAQAALVAQYATNELRGRYSDFDQERERISAVIENNPRFRNDDLWGNPTTATAALDEAYKLVKAEDLLAGKLPAQPGYDAEAAKVAAQTATGGSPRPATPDEQAAAWERVKNANASSYTELMKNA